MKTLRIGSDRGVDLDLACAEAERFVLWRRGQQVHVTLDDGRLFALRRALALRGIATTELDCGVPDPPRLLAAIGTGLSPARLSTLEELDVLHVRVVPLGEATARLLRRPQRLWPLVGRKRARCRALLRGSDALLEVRRSAWCGRATIGASRRSLRPLLFDRSATAPAQLVFAADGALTRWLNG